MLIKNYTNCSTAGLRQLDIQLVEQINRLSPDTLIRFDDFPNIECGSAVHPYLQPAATKALRKAVVARGIPMKVNSAYRTLAQQCVLYQHYQNGRCGIPIAAIPGRSNHQGGLAIDIEDAQGWRSFLQQQGWRWYGLKDKVHFDFILGGKDIRKLTVKAFQILYNQNNGKKISEDGLWGASTYEALKSAPVEGFKTATASDNKAIDIPDAKPVLDLGDTGENVKILQSLLVKAGFEVRPDGDFGKATWEAVKKYQAANGLISDGVVGVATWSELEEVK